MLAGGVRRLVGPRAQLTVHSMGLGQRVKTYLKEMAVGPGLLVAMRSVPASRHRQLEPDMMLKVGLTTGLESADEFTGPTICKSEPMPENCRMVSTSEVQADAPVKL
ncbi:hypothetical protein [Mesorhizobium wenxiniae]|uniref:hypothetical protein n=1 Tax=Mesorhizobium wenxiniae TaxID=2014805 RepID=UPI001FDA74B7|nr:hypothetical protein [Mesorhizobium wenxiniae]